MDDTLRRKEKMLNGEVKSYRRPALLCLGLGTRHHHQDLRKRKKKTKQNKILV